MFHVWVTDCVYLSDQFTSPKSNHVENHLLEIKIVALRKQVWERSGERIELVECSAGDYPPWIDTSTMLADPLTKAVHSARLVLTIGTG